MPRCARFLRYHLCSPYVSKAPVLLERCTPFRSPARSDDALSRPATSNVRLWVAVYFSSRLVNLLFYEIIKDTCQNGYKWFDFNPSGDHQGVKAFKKNFGTTALSCPLLCARPPKNSLDKAIGRLARYLPPTDGK
jgi:hypothetical protein